MRHILQGVLGGEAAYIPFTLSNFAGFLGTFRTYLVSSSCMSLQALC